MKDLRTLAVLLILGSLTLVVQSCSTPFTVNPVSPTPPLTFTPSSTPTPTGTLTVTATPTHSMTPTNSPTGTLTPSVTNTPTSTPANDIVFFGQPWAIADVWVMNADGSNQRNLTNQSIPTHQYCQPQWSPNKSKILAMQCGPADNSELLTMNANGTGLAYLGVSGQAFSWSPDGTQVLYHNGGAPTSICTISATGGTPVSLAVGSFPCYSPGGTTIVYCNDVWDICVIGTGGTGLTNLTNFGGSATGYYPQYSPDGSKILYIVNTASTHNVVVMNSNGSSPTTITSYPSTSGVAQAKWSPDGTKIAYEWGTASNHYLSVMNNDGSNVVPLSTTANNNTDPHWSPDSQTIIFNDSNSALDRIQANGTGFTTLTPFGVYYVGDWTPSY